MTIVVEDGSIVAGANSYVSAADLTAYATTRGITLITDPDQLLIKAMDYIESLSYKGTKQTRNQPLEWPRYNVFIDGYYVQTSFIPQQLKNGEMETAIAIDQSEDPLATSPRQTVREKVDVIEVEYSQGAAALPYNKRITNALWKLLTNGNGGNQVVVGKA